MNHANLKNSILIEANKLPGIKLWPNPTGLAWNGTVVREWTDRGKKYLILENPRPVKYGMGKGILDTVGFKVENIGRTTVPRFIAFDAKTSKDRLSAEQKNFIKMVSKYGGIADEIRHTGEIQERLSQGLRFHTRKE